MQALFQKLFTIPGSDTPPRYQGNKSDGNWTDGKLIGNDDSANYPVVGGIPLFLGESEKTDYPKSDSISGDNNITGEELIHSNWKIMRTDPDIDRLYNDWAQTILDTNGKILELTAGQGGGLAPLLLDYDADIQLLIHGVDFRILKGLKELIDSDGNWKSVGITQFDASRCPIKSDSFEAINSFIAISNMRRTGGVLSEIRRILRPGGRLFMLDFEIIPDSLEQLPDSVLKKMAEFDPDFDKNYKSRLTEAGFGIEYFSLTEDHPVQPRENCLADIAARHNVQLKMQAFRMEARKPINIDFDNHPFSADSIP